MRLVKTATSNSMPSTRASASACEETSIATPPMPRSRISPSICWISSASGVVWPAGRTWSPIMYWMVPMTPVRSPRARSSAFTRYDVVVLPLVPVMPTTTSAADGWP